MSSSQPTQALPFRVWFDFPQIDCDSYMTFYLLIDQREYGPYPTKIKTTPFIKLNQQPHPVPRFNVDKAVTLEKKLLQVWQELPPQSEQVTGELIMQRFRQLPKTKRAKGGPEYGH